MSASEPKADIVARLFWIARKPETHLFSTAACFDGTLVGVDCERELTREPEANFRLGVLLPGMYDHFLSWDPQAVLRSATRTCPNSFVSESISRTFPDTHQRHGGFAELARRFS